MLWTMDQTLQKEKINRFENVAVEIKTVQKEMWKKNSGWRKWMVLQ